MKLNKIFTSINGWLKVQIYGQTDQNGNPLVSDTLEGLPIGTTDESSTGELGVKTIIIADRSASSQTSLGFQIPAYDRITSAYYGSTNNVETQVYSLSGVTVRTLTFTYAGGGSANNDLVTIIAAS